MSQNTDQEMISSLSKNSLRLAVKSKTWSPTQSEWILAGACVQPKEKERIGRFVFKKDSKSAMIGRLLIRAATSHMLGIPFTDIKLGRTEKGKPIILNDLPPEFSNYNFNISHQGDYVVLAAEKQHQVGIDVMDSQFQRGTSISKFFGVMKRHLTENEWKTVASYSTESDQMELFYRHWCLKESLVKALGIGIGFEIGKLEFTLPTRDLSTDKISRDSTVKIDGKPDPQWLFEETMLGDHCVAVAIRNQNNNTQSNFQTKENDQGFHRLTVPELLKSCVPLPGSSPDMEYWTSFTNKSEQPVHVS